MLFAAYSAASARLKPPRVLRSRGAWIGWSLLVLLAAAATFYLPALLETGGRWPAPLDDTYIYFDYARSTALGHPLAWLPDAGYSSGATSVLYPLLLAPLWALGLRGSALGIGAALLALACLFDLCRSLRSIAPRIAWLAPLWLVAVPLLDWSLWSGMETALFAAVLGRSLLSTRAALDAPAHLRAGKQVRAGIWLALLVLTRPESIALVFALGVAVAHGARSLRADAALLRAWLAPGVALAAQAALNRALTGEWAQAGAVRKLIWSDPYRDNLSSLVEVARNLLLVSYQALWRGLGGALGFALLMLLVAVAIASRAHRRLGLALSIGAVGSLLIASNNTTAPYQNLRYAAPCLCMLLCAGYLGSAAWAKRWWPAAPLALGLFYVATSSQLGAQVHHFARASDNILSQQGEVARKLAALEPPPRRVLINDAGVIPYLSELPALDGLGLGGFRGMPFARASVHGLPAVVELIERLPPGERPDVFGREIDRVAIDDNVICGAPIKVIYRADWSSLAAADAALPGELERMDVADMIDEREHGYRFPAPSAGWIIADILESDLEHARRWDAGRIVPRGRQESYTLTTTSAGPVTLWLRSDADGPAGAGPDLVVQLLRDERTIHAADLPMPPRADGHWNELSVELPAVRAGDRLVLDARGRDWRSFKAWLVRH